MPQFVTLTTKDARRGGEPGSRGRRKAAGATGHGACRVAIVQQAVALVADSNWAMRELMRRTIQGAGFMVLESANAPQLEVALRMRLLATAPRALLVVSATLLDEARDVLLSLSKQRASTGFSLPHVILTCEFGALAETPRGDLSGCIPAGMLEKPFDFALLQGIAYRCRTFPAGVQPLVVNGR